MGIESDLGILINNGLSGKTVSAGSGLRGMHCKSNETLTYYKSKLLTSGQTKSVLCRPTHD